MSYLRLFLECAIATNRLGLYRKRKIMTKSSEECGSRLMGIIRQISVYPF